ncbi:MAG: DUF86 domain-containing protein [Jaaginema sp. PMC 1079.18]|nr:DUF86 domain-containing protein [Jaaginema sp. PMC 1080.18]MEC4850034.1 DUF86 domain-containing protein [Jaaginema sp. PMC 1079.18]MEC4869027.1 DUF86 domain-containing protein [Jaaginema sp. PMC 1078.18]
MSRNLNLYLADILNSIAKIQKYVTDLTYRDFCADDKTLDAVIHNLLIIGEATKQIPDSLRSKYSQIEWQKIAGIRDIIAHTYFYINPKIVWNIITTQLVPLQTTVQLILNNEDL